LGVLSSLSKVEATYHQFPDQIHLTISSLNKYAPSDSVRQQAERLLQKGRWRHLGRGEALVWGEVRSRGATYFRVLFEPEQERFYCNCSARQQPCSHILALAAWSSSEPSADPSKEEPPVWVSSYLERLQTIEIARQQQAMSDEDRKKRQEQRLQNRARRVQVMQEGMQDLSAWLEDVIRQGIAQLESYSPEQWERIAARMVDAKLGSVARRLRTLPERIGSANWPEEVLEEIGALFLLAEGFQRLEDLPDELQDEMLSQAGINFKKEEVLAEPSVIDHWVIAGLETGHSENLQFRRAWLQSTQFPRNALLLDFVWGDQPFEQHWRVGQQFEAEVAYYPGPFPQRALLKSFQLRPELEWALAGYSQLEELATDYADALGYNPWLQQFPALLTSVTPLQVGPSNWALVDSEGYTIPLGGPTSRHWALLAQSGGRPIDLFGVFDGKHFEVLSVLTSPTTFLPLS
jgi:hypothetical protein